VEFSYLADSGLYKINFFKTHIDESIVFNSDAFTENSGHIDSEGLEASWESKGNGWLQALNISLYRGDEDSSPEQLASDNKQYLGFPTFKATWQLDYEWSNKTVLHPSIIIENEKYWRADQQDPTKDVKLDGVILINFFVSHQLTHDITLQAGVHDLLNDGYFFPQAYGQVLYPGDSREFSLSIEVGF
jgi:outer membrane cobalamin receptor